MAILSLPRTVGDLTNSAALWRARGISFLAPAPRPPAFTLSHAHLLPCHSLSSTEQSSEGVYSPTRFLCGTRRLSVLFSEK